MDLYFERHDGAAVTCDDFRAAMADANGVADGLAQFETWYSQAGTPEVVASSSFDATTGTYTLELTQSCAPSPEAEVIVAMSTPPARPHASTVRLPLRPHPTRPPCTLPTSTTTRSARWSCLPEL